jgi:hypothetical protein
MKKLLFVCALLGAAIAAQAQVVYSSIPGPYFAAAAATGVLGIDDYTSTASGATFEMPSMRFAGGVTVANSQVLFEFLDNTNTLQNSFTVALPQAGNFIWTITLGPGFMVPTAGRLRLTSAQATGQWFLTSTAPSVGTNSTSFGGGTGPNQEPLYHVFELSAVPEPGSMAALGCGIAALVARRRRKAGKV